MSNIVYLIKYNTLYKLTLYTYLKCNFKTWKINFFLQNSHIMKKNKT